MGYSHYWKGSVECTDQVWAHVLQDLATIAERAGIPLAGARGSGRPAWNNAGICFNGQGVEAHESFIIDRYSNPSAFGFCKTAQKPYDIVVCATLIILNHYIPTFHPSSDGDERDWQDAIDMVEHALGYGVYPCKDWEEDRVSSGGAMMPITQVVGEVLLVGRPKMVDKEK